MNKILFSLVLVCLGTMEASAQHVLNSEHVAFISETPAALRQISSGSLLQSPPKRLLRWMRLIPWRALLKPKHHVVVNATLLVVVFLHALPH